MHPATELFSHRPYRMERSGIAPFLPMSRTEMDKLGWDSCDIILVTGDAYVDHPSFGMALIGRLLESHGFRVGIIAQPDWRGIEDFNVLGRPKLFWGVTAGNMDSMVNRYTADRRIRSDDAYTPDAEGGRRPERSVIVYAQRCREAYRDVPLVIGGIEASLRRIAHYDYWSEKVRRTVLLDAKADLLVYGNGERAAVEIAHRLSRGEAIDAITDLRGTAFVRRGLPAGWQEIESSEVDEPGPARPRENPYATTPAACANGDGPDIARAADLHQRPRRMDRAHTVIRLPAYERVKQDPVYYAHASRVLHLETNPGNARALVQRHGDRDVWLNPPPIPLNTREMDRVYELPYARLPHPAYQGRRLPAYEMIRFSITIMRGCFGGCSFCSITEHEGRIIQNRSEDSIIQEVARVRDGTPGFTGVISDLGGPTANMYRLHCNNPAIEAACRRPSCVYPGICENLDTDHSHLVGLYRRTRRLPGIKKVLVASGLRYDLALRSPDYVRELVSHHVGGYLKIAPEHTEDGPLSRMMKPGIGTYERFKQMFERFSRKAGKKQYLIPYFIAAHPGTSDQDMLQLALWLKRNDLRADQVQTFLPSPMASATAMYHTGLNPLKRIRTAGNEKVFTARGARQRRLHKAFLRYHDTENWPLLRDALKRMGRSDLIGNGKHHLIPGWQPQDNRRQCEGKRGAGSFQTRQERPQRKTVPEATQRRGRNPPQDSSRGSNPGSPTGRGKRRR